MNISKKRILIILIIIISIIILSIINYKINNSKKLENNQISETQEENIISQNLISNNINSNNESQKNNNSKNTKKNQSEKQAEIINKNISDNGNWYISIQSINLKAPIMETTENNILENYVGHFEETSLTIGNIGLVAHNRGYKNNYFENLKNAKKGDNITYKYNDYLNNYKIEKIEKIKNTNWSYLENTKENKLTLITCIENEPEYRLCVQAVENKNN